MLERIQRIHGVGLLHQTTNSRKFKLRKRTLLYAHNGVGKSTLASVFSSCSSSDPNLLVERRTVDGSISQEVQLHFSQGIKANFQDGQWDGGRNKFLVFDSHFINTNVHSDAAVSAEQRKNLLNFAIGANAVAARKDEEEASKRQRDAKSSITDISAAVSAHSGTMDLDEFETLEPQDDIQVQIETALNRLSAAERSDRILAQPLPEIYSFPDLDLQSLFELLATELEDVHQSAEEIVSNHIQHLGFRQAHQWLETGQNVGHDSHCPFCGQDTHGIQLIQMYKSFFNDSYKDLKSRVEIAQQGVGTILSDSFIESIVSQTRQNHERYKIWSEFLVFDRVVPPKLENFDQQVEELRSLLLSLLEQKTASVVTALAAPEPQQRATVLWDGIVGLLRDQNEAIDTMRNNILQYRSELAGTEASKVRAELDTLRKTAVRYSPEVQELFENLEAARTELRLAEQAKETARENLSSIMERILDKYGQEINRHLERLGATFKIHGLKPNYLGGTPRTAYEVKLRDVPIKLTGGAPSFATALSEGDKRTMAFAFFVASTLEDPDLSEKIVVVDDPMSSLDRARRTYTQYLLSEIAKQAKQTVIMAHDETFLRDLRLSWEKELVPPEEILELRLTPSAKWYSDFDAISLDRLCESDYQRNYRLVSDYLEGVTTEVERCAQALRPLLEGYIHRRYPLEVPEGKTLGLVIQAIENAIPRSPMFGSRGDVPALKEINAYVSQFHHDTEPNYADRNLEQANPYEVRAYAERIMRFIHGYADQPVSVDS